MFFKDLFSAQASTYQKFRPQYPEELFTYLAGTVGAHDRVWDCGTGNGQAARALAKHFKSVIATDASQGQIDSAVAHPSVEYRVAPAEGSGLPAASVDLITVAQALHWFDLDPFYAEVNRVLKPGGRIAVWCYGITKVHTAIDAIVEGFYSGTLNGYWDPARHFIDEEYRTIAFPFPEGMSQKITQCGFQVN